MLSFDAQANEILAAANTGIIRMSPGDLLLVDRIQNGGVYDVTENDEVGFSVLLAITRGCVAHQKADG